MIRGKTLLLTATLFLSGCSTRERLNPLDPKNTATQGGLAGFNAIAADDVVEFRWPALSVEGVVGYRVQRWRPGDAPQPLGLTDYHADASAGEDSAVVNDSTYVYRLIAHLANGDSAVSPPDTATPGVRRIFVLEANVPSISRLSPDGRDLLFERVSDESYVDLELDRNRGLLWLVAETDGLVLRKSEDGATIGAVLPIGAPGDVSVSENRGIGWVVSLSEQRVVSFGPDLNDPTPQRWITAVGSPRVVEAGSLDPTVWVGNEEGVVYRFRSQDLFLTHQWTLGAGSIRAIALDESVGCAWVATRLLDSGSLFYLNPADSSATLVRTNLSNTADLAVDPRSGDLWLSERGPSGFGVGRLSRIARSGATLATVNAIEPYGLDVDPIDGSCWVTDLRSNRLLHVDRSGAILQSSTRLETPYAVRVAVP